jgi:hypothetical protein
MFSISAGTIRTNFGGTITFAVGLCHEFCDIRFRFVSRRESRKIRSAATVPKNSVNAQIRTCDNICNAESDHPPENPVAKYPNIASFMTVVSPPLNHQSLSSIHECASPVGLPNPLAWSSSRHALT